MRRPLRRAIGALLPLSVAPFAAGCARAPRGEPAAAATATSRAAPSALLPRTRAERTGYRETSRHADVVAFLDSLRALGAPVRVASLGRSAEGRDIPFVVASRPLVAGPEEARRLGRPVVYVQGNIHGGEVEGKEALQALLRDLSLSRAPNALDSIVLVAVPLYNADGNERLAAQAVNRSEQNGPELVGERTNGAGLDLNRDYVKAEAPETRAALALFREWDPDVFVDLHTTDGSYHGYALTYAPPLEPSAPLAAHTRDSILPELRRRMRARRGIETFDYGNFSLRYGEDVNTDTVRHGWFSYDHRPRFGSNYYGLRGRVGILSEAYSHDPFERRVASTRAFVSEVLSLAAERRPMAVDVIGRLRREAAVACLTDLREAARVAVNPPRGCALALHSRLTTTPYVGEVIAEDLARAADTTTLAEPGLARGLRRTGRFRRLRMPVHDRFTPELVTTTPAAYFLDPSLAAAVELLRMHGVVVERLAATESGETDVFAIDSLAVSPRPFQGHREVRLAGRWRSVRGTLPAGGYVVATAQPLGLLAAYLLEPQSDDGLATWNVLDGALRPGGDFPVRRLRALPAAAARRDAR